jgi:type I restriction-modification system DNA methylase subunit
MDAGEIAPASEIAFWRAWLEVLRGLRIVDPACGSGAFLVAALDRLAQEYQPVLARLEELGAPGRIDAFDEILTKNLYGVDVNPESVEITRLSLWLKTARRDRRLQNLETTICVGDSIVSDRNVSARAFNWRATFPHVFERGGFDVVIGNPPYVRMELLNQSNHGWPRILSSRRTAPIFTPISTSAASSSLERVDGLASSPL